MSTPRMAKPLDTEGRRGRPEWRYRPKIPSSCRFWRGNGCVSIFAIVNRLAGRPGAGRDTSASPGGYSARCGEPRVGSDNAGNTWSSSSSRRLPRGTSITSLPFRIRRSMTKQRHSVGAIILQRVERGLATSLGAAPGNLVAPHHRHSADSAVSATFRNAHFRGPCHGHVPTGFVNTTPSGRI
jgi:hypothetical protein